MKNKIVLWGTDANDERILVALELKVNDNKVMIYTFTEAQASDEFYQLMMDQWRNDKGEVAFPETYQTYTRELSITESLLPEEVKVERTDVIQRAQTEWHFVVLSSKLSEVYRTELSDLEEKLAKLKDYDKELWAGLKTFWGKVQQQMRDRTLLREHADEIKARTNKAFDQMKALRSKMDESFRTSSKENMDRFGAIMDDVENKIKENTHLNKLFDELKRIQKDLRDATFTKEHRNKMWQRIDDAFKAVKEKRFGEKSSGGNRGSSALDRISSRYNGLMGAIDKMERSIKRDEDDLAFQTRRQERTDGQLEAQILVAKIKMIEQRVESKREKYDDMLKTKAQLEAKIEKEKKREVERQQKAEEEKARQAAAAAAKEKIAADIREQQASVDEGVTEQLSDAAKAINEQKGAKTARPLAADTTETTEEAAAETEAPKAAKEESLLGAIGAALSEPLENLADNLNDVVDTVKAVAEVVGDRLEDKAEEMMEKAEAIKDDVEQAVEEIKDKVEEKVEDLKDSVENKVDDIKEKMSEEE